MLTQSMAVEPAAGISLTKIMAVEWARHGIRVNAISPGPTATPMFMSIYGSAFEKPLPCYGHLLPKLKFYLQNPVPIGSSMGFDRC